MKSLLFLSLFFLFACSSDDNKDVPSHYFNSADYEYLPTVYEEVGKTFRYENQLGEEVTLKVSSYDDIQYYVGPNDILEKGNYARLSVKLINENYQDCFKRIDINKYANDNLHFTFSTSYSQPCGGWIDEYLKSPFETSEMTINGKVYDKVTILFESYPDFDGPFFHPDYIIDIIYYDFKYGIIGFDDTSSNVQFRLVK